MQHSKPPASRTPQHRPSSFQPPQPQASGAQPMQRQPPLPQPAQTEIRIPLTITLGRSFQLKLPFLLGLLLIFTFTLIIFDKANLNTMDLSDLQRLQYNVQKIYSVSMFLFIILFALSLAIAIYYSLSLGWAAGLLVVPATFIPAIALGLAFYPWLVGAFMVFATVVSFAAVVSSVWHQLSLSRAWAVLSASMLLFTILSFFVVFYKVAGTKDLHVNSVLDLLGPFKDQIYAMPVFKIVYDHFAFLFASLALLAAAFVGFFIQITALALLFALQKLLPINE
ncbi:TPA: hypothetical protein HA244_00240 [Candidatus Micrarchaeota archaeon]|nr:hypothetical protein [Candidatus Micrarchaeota archaeon]